MLNFRLWIAALSLLAISMAVAKVRPEAEDPTLVRAKRAAVITDRAVQYLASHQTDGLVKVWVYFTDKGIFNKAQLQQAAQLADAGMTERAKARRLKHGVTDVKFTDLPVYARYVDQLTQQGAHVLRTSKWLNAVAIEIAPNRLGSLATAEFVASIEPAVTMKRALPVEEPLKGDAPVEKQSLGTHALSYGNSLGQLAQINVPVCHDSGYAGQGIIISMFDTGFRKTHNSFANHYLDGRVLAEWDFVYNDGNVANEAADWSSAWSHGTSTWSTSGGENPGVHYGPAYEASFILCKTEDVRDETIQEEYNWVAAIEWVDSIGTDIVSSSLGYTDWYTAPDYDGNTCATTVAADIAAANGILVVNSAGNSGPGASTLGAPADADSIVTVGAVGSTGTIVSFSSRGPTADGRIKPEVCAQGSSVSVASSGGDASYTFSSGTSFSCPLTAGVAAIVWGGHPDWTNMQVREALMMTASQSATPDNNYGWGIVNAWSALHYSYAPVFLPGDADSNGKITVSDAVYLINYIFSGGTPPTPTSSGDADCSGSLSISDAVYLINFVFAGGPPPALCL